MADDAPNRLHISRHNGCPLHRAPRTEDGRHAPAGLLALGSDVFSNLPSTQRRASGIFRSRTRRSQLRGQPWSQRARRLTTFPLHLGGRVPPRNQRTQIQSGSGSFVNCGLLTVADHRTSDVLGATTFLGASEPQKSPAQVVRERVMLPPIPGYAVTEVQDARQMRLWATACLNRPNVDARLRPRKELFVDLLSCDGTPKGSDAIVRKAKFALGVERREMKDSGPARSRVGPLAMLKCIRIDQHVVRRPKGHVGVVERHGLVEAGPALRRGGQIGMGWPRCRGELGTASRADMFACHWSVLAEGWPQCDWDCLFGWPEWPFRKANQSGL